MQDREEVRLSVEGRRLGSYANKGRWRSFFESLDTLERQLDHSFRVRVKVVSSDRISDWSNWLTPVPDCFEHLRTGPMIFSYIEWLDIETTYNKDRGRLVSPEIFNVQEEVRKNVIESKLTATYEETYTRVWGYK